MKPMMVLEFDGNSVTVLRAPWGVMPLLRENFEADGLEVVDARTRRWDKWVMILAIVLFILDGSWLFLLSAILAGDNWVKSYPRSES